MATESPSVQASEDSPLEVATDGRTARADWRSSIYGALLTTLLLGVWLIASAAALDYAKPALAIVWGIVIVLLTLLRLLGPTRSRILALATAAAGALAAISAVLAAESAAATANIALLGLATAVLSIISLAAGTEDERRSRP